MKICIGHGTDGEILEDLEKAKACNYCTKFMGLGLHWISGRCKETGEELLYSEYQKAARDCENFECCPELIRK
jgi:hypothetical protein